MEGWKDGRLTRIFWITGFDQDKTRQDRKDGRMEGWKIGRDV